MRRSRALATGVAFAVLVLSAAGCGGSSSSIKTRDSNAYDVLRELEPEVDQAATTSDRAVLVGVDSNQYPQRPQLRVVVYADWTPINRLLVGTASDRARPIGFCRQVGAGRMRRVCVVADRVTAEALPYARKPNLVASFASRYCWGWDKHASNELCVGKVPPPRP